MLDHILLPSRPRLLSAGAVGAILAVLALVHITLPILPLLAQFTAFSRHDQLTLLIKLCAPLLTLVLAGGWIWLLLSTGDLLLAGRIMTLLAAHREDHQQQQAREPSLISPSPEAREPEVLASPAVSLQEPHEPVLLLEHEMVPVRELPSVGQTTPEEAVSSEADVLDVAPVQESTHAPYHVPVKLDLQADDEEQAPGPREQAEEFTIQRHEEAAESDPPITITLLKQVRMWVRAQDGTRQEVTLRGGENYLRLIIFAYIAWKQGKPVDRDKLMTYVIARGRRRDLETDQLSEIFDAAKKYVRQDLYKTTRKLEEAGHPLESKVDLFSVEPGFYWLDASCRIMDLSEVDKHHESLVLARQQGLLDEKLDGSLPAWVVTACKKLLRAYSGDFLQSLLEKYPDEFGSWVREPFTLYRDKYLDALLILANYESALGRNFVDGQMTEEQRAEHRRAHIAKAAQHYYDYVMFCLKGPFGLRGPWDSKLAFAYRKDKDGERVVMAARALRRCVVELGKLGKTDMIDQVYLTFKEKMGKLSEGHWQPAQATESDVLEAKKTTGAYRFSAQVQAVTPHKEAPHA
jgi:hypothetical protein